MWKELMVLPIHKSLKIGLHFVYIILYIGSNLFFYIFQEAELLFVICIRTILQFRRLSFKYKYNFRPPSPLNISGSANLRYGNDYNGYIVLFSSFGTLQALGIDRYSCGGNIMLIQYVAGREMLQGLIQCGRSEECTPYTNP